jgi:hypothetical protein
MVLVIATSTETAWRLHVDETKNSTFYLDNHNMSPSQSLPLATSFACRQMFDNTRFQVRACSRSQLARGGNKFHADDDLDI